MGKPDPQDLLQLADEVASALPEMQAVMLDRAWEALAKHSAEFRAFATAPLSSFSNNAGKFGVAVDAHAYETAAMMLVPEGAGFNLDRYWLREGVAWKVEIATGGTPEQPRQVFDCWDAYTASLAITAAALKARAHSTKESDNG